MTGNVQDLPPGLAGRVAAAATNQPAPAAPAAPVQPSPADLAPAAPAAPAPVAPAVPTTPPALPINPMLSALSQPKPADPAAPAVPAQPPQPKAPEVPAQKQAAPTGSVAELAGTFAKDSALAPAVSYLDAILADNDVDIQRALGQAADELDPRFIDAHYLKEKLGDKAATVIKIAQDTIKYVQDYHNESLRQVVATAGSQAQWEAAAQAFNAKADPQEKAMLVQLLESGERDSMLYAAQKIAQFGVQAGVVTRHNPAALGQPGTEKGLSHKEYIEAISQRNVTPEAYNQLRAQRELGRRQGL